MPSPANLVHEISSTTGTGNLTVAAVNGKVRFSDATYAFGTGGSDVFWYFIMNQAASEWEVGTGSMSDANTLVRDTVIASSNSDALVSFSAGTKDVTNDIPAAFQLLAASTAEVRAGTASTAIVASHLTSANALVTLTDAATIAIDWTSGINFTVTLTTDRVLGNPTNEIPGTFRTVFVISDGGPDTLTFGSEYGGTPPTLTDITTTQGYLLSIYCRAAGQFLVSSMDGSPA